MSSLLFPLSALGAYIDSKEPYQGVLVDEAASGKEYRQTWWTSPRWKYRIKFEVLNGIASGRQDLQQMLMQFLRHAQGDSFLLDDPEDDSVTDMGFGVGDGVTTAFQLQRQIGGKVTDRSGFSYAPQSKPYVNLLRNSSFETDSNADGLADSWNQYNNTASIEPAVWTIVPGANGGKAQRVSWGTNNTTSKGVFAVAQTVGVWTGFVVGQWYTASFVARAQGGVVGQLPTTTFGVFPANFTPIAQPAVTGAWQRYVFQFKWNAGQVPDGNAYFMACAFGNACFGDFDIDLVQVTPGQWGLNDLQPLETAAAAAGTDTPAFFPSQSDGFEPVYELSAPPTIYQDGDWMGRRTIYPYVRTNLLPFSEQFSNAAWVKAGTLTATADTTAAPDGTTTADTINEGAGNDAKNISQNTSPAEVQGELRCYSVFVKANNLPNMSYRISTSNFGINFNLSTGVIDSTNGALEASGVITSPLWPGWYRIWFVKRVTATLGTGARLLPCLDGTYSAAAYLGTSRTFFAWGAMAERTSNLLGPTPYIKTPSSAAVTVTDYTLSSLGLVTPSPVLPSGAYLSADLSFYKRVRLAQPGLPLQRICQLMWSTGVELVGVRP